MESLLVSLPSEPPCPVGTGSLQINPYIRMRQELTCNFVLEVVGLHKEKGNIHCLTRLFRDDSTRAAP